MLTLLVLLAAVLFAGFRLLTFVYYKKHDISLSRIDSELAERFAHPDSADRSESGDPGRIS
ncbi:hypothetical protein SAMN02799630_03813 [Paenibacillus sp. UNCCL117]|uniref:hypothetical protein n=1 Tax=unclassified Paenibacillus TaxID=185978 RepID=UPI0008827AC3|nr:MULTISPECIES: hypothetical protein [unclassified Paenibacillus]SDD59127.1 hypothetical protein SAMN04488602_110124 [Paenibacillus sp. cl123]SFW50874.1 hypothetical protein SAMN02799630_03813 [Paenibacillus sp. UNCCL117]